MSSSSIGAVGRTVEYVASVGRLAYHVEVHVPGPPVVSRTIRSSLVPPVPLVQFAHTTPLTVPPLAPEPLPRKAELVVEVGVAEPRINIQDRPVTLVPMKRSFNPATLLWPLAKPSASQSLLAAAAEEVNFASKV